MESNANGDVKKSRPPLGDIGNKHIQMPGDPEEDIKNIKFNLDELLKGASDCQARLNVVSEQRCMKLKHDLKKLTEGITKSDTHHQQDMAVLKAMKEEMNKREAKEMAALKAKDEEMKAKDEEMRKLKADLEAKEAAALKAKDEEMKAKDEEMRKLKAKDEEMRKLKADLEAANRAKEVAKDEEMKAKDEEMRKLKADLEADNRAKEVELEALRKEMQAALMKKDEDLAMANRRKERDQVSLQVKEALLKVKDELLEDMAAGVKNSNMDQVEEAAIRALLASLERTKMERDKIQQERDAALQGRQMALDEREDAEMQLAAHWDEMGHLLRPSATFVDHLLGFNGL